METAQICFPAPLDACFPLTCGPGVPALYEEGDEPLEALGQSAPAGCYLCKLDNLFGEDWE